MASPSRVGTMYDAATSATTLNPRGMQYTTALASGSPLCSLELHFNGLHHPTTRSARENPDNSSSRPVHKNGPLYRPPRKCDRKRRRGYISSGSLETSRIADRNDIGHGREVFPRILGVIVQDDRSKTIHVNSVAPSN